MNNFMNKIMCLVNLIFNHLPMTVTGGDIKTRFFFLTLKNNQELHIINVLMNRSIGVKI